MQGNTLFYSHRILQKVLRDYFLAFFYRALYMEQRGRGEVAISRRRGGIGGRQVNWNRNEDGRKGGAGGDGKKVGAGKVEGKIKGKCDHITINSVVWVYILIVETHQGFRFLILWVLHREYDSSVLDRSIIVRGKLDRDTRNIENHKQSVPRLKSGKVQEK